MEEINNILESLRRALQNVDSARVQTERTVNAYNDLQETVRTYILSIENSVEALNQMLTIYENSKTEMENSVYNAVKTILDKSNEVKTDFERSVQSSINTFNRGIEDNLNNLRTSVSELSEENSKLINLKRDIDSLCQKLDDFKTDIKGVEKKLEKGITDNTSLLGSLSNETKVIGNNVNRSFDEMKAMYSEGNKKLHNMIVVNVVLLVIILVLMFIK
ncbi:hypothetical protein AAH037_03775 [Phocaeicola vulgatus]|jgi:DNA repair exonuclease SbcCD ATPase subunit|uniref:hypothetical protein n=1 Tax=Phocaeicola vulgatus TaxID=821 RepID=UPI00106FC289|nr:hypothetical protein E1J05_01730 [Phocaeicola dorei]TDA91147.1 hypothetical protein E1J02_03525 [Phocaeicola dorei]